MIRFFIKAGMVVWAYTYGIVPGLIATSLVITIEVNGKRVW